MVSIPLVDQSAKAGGSFTYAIAAGSFTDIDQGDVLTHSTTLEDGSPLPTWLAFDAQTQTFSGRVPRDATGFIDIPVPPLQFLVVPFNLVIIFGIITVLTSTLISFRRCDTSDVIDS